MDGFYIPGAKLSTLEDLFRKVVREEINEALLPLSNCSEKDPEIITRHKAAEILSISLNTLHDWTVRGILQSYRIGTRIRYKKEDVFNALKEVEIPTNKR